MKKRLPQDALIFGTDESIKSYTPTNGKTLTLAEVQMIVDGYIEILTLTPSVIMVVNEEGKLQERKPNIRATIIARQLDAIALHDYIAGEAIICPANMLP